MVGWLVASRTLGGLVAGEGLSALRHSRGLGCRMPESRVTLLFSKRTDVPDRDPNYRNAPMSPTVTQIIETRDAAAVTHLSKRAMSPTVTLISPSATTRVRALDLALGRARGGMGRGDG